MRFLKKAVRQHGLPAKVTIDKTGAKIEIEIRQIKYLNKLVEQDHRAVKRMVRPMLGFKSFP